MTRWCGRGEAGCADGVSLESGAGVWHEDKTTENLRRSFDQAADMIQRNMDLNLTTLVHCSDGRGRAAAVRVAFLMLVHCSYGRGRAAAVCVAFLMRKMDGGWCPACL
ncbi:hypothetical protein T484DRAFT_1796738 [Baffinella frigidus]|nr:hypothetical protein T484DRAFT_1796738 [Cryptophyta sp. CCMP2293]